MIEKILWLRQQYPFGPQKITMYLKRYHDITISASGVWRILKKVGLNRLPASQRYKRRETRWKRCEKQRPGHALQVDVKFIEPVARPGGRSATTNTVSLVVGWSGTGWRGWCWLSCCGRDS